MEIDKKIMAEKLKKEIKKCGYTQQALADLVGVTLPTVNSWVTGKSAPHPYTQNKLSELFKVRKAYLFGGSDIRDYATLYLQKSKIKKEKEEIIIAFISCCDFFLEEKTDNYIIVSDHEKQKYKLLYSEIDILIKDFECLFRNRLKSVFLE